RQSGRRASCRCWPAKIGAPVLAAATRLACRQREVLVLRYYLGLADREIAFRWSGLAGPPGELGRPADLPVVGGPVARREQRGGDPHRLAAEPGQQPDALPGGREPARPPGPPGP